MLKQIYASQGIQYNLPTPGASAPYFDYLTTPPRLYMETIATGGFPLGLFSKLDSTSNSETTITLMGVTQQIYFPGWELIQWRFDGVTGAFIDRVPMTGDVYAGALALNSFVQGFDGSLWASYITGSMAEFDPVSYTLMQTVPASRFGRSSVLVPLVDKARDICIMPSESGAFRVMVYTLSTGALVREIGVSALPTSICAEDDKRIYVLGSNYVLSLIDYTTGEIISAIKIPTPPAVTYVMTTWDRILRRVLVFAVVPDASDGSCASQVKGYYPVDVATYLTTPIPLVAPRRGRQIPVLLRAVGDLGEPIAGVAPQLSATGGVLVMTAPQGTDANGESTATLLCVSPGSATLTATATIDD